jgi:hypothetical protein
MQGRWLGPLIALGIAACGNAFTAATSDGGLEGHDAAIDTGVPGGDDSGATPDASRDASSDAMSTMDSPVTPPVEGGGGGMGDASSSCAHTCPSGFACVLGKCEDRVLLNFLATTNTSGNWTYGYFENNATSAFMAYPIRGASDGLDTWGLSAGSIEPSALHNPALMAVNFTGLTPGPVQVPAGGIVLYPSSTLASAVRWTAPVAGQVDISATFTGLGTSPLTMTGANVNIGLAIVFSQTVNAFNGPNAVTYTASSQKVNAGDVIYFFVQFVTTGDDIEGATGFEAHFTLD